MSVLEVTMTMLFYIEREVKIYFWRCQGPDQPASNFSCLYVYRLVSGSGDIKLTKDGNVLLHEMVGIQ